MSGDYEPKNKNLFISLSSKIGEVTLIQDPFKYFHD